MFVQVQYDNSLLTRVKKPSIRTLQECDAKWHSIRGAFTEIIRFELERETLFQDMLTNYETIVSCNSELRLKFSKEKGVGYGVCREVFAVFLASG